MEKRENGNFLGKPDGRTHQPIRRAFVPTDLEAVQLTDGKSVQRGPRRAFAEVTAIDVAFLIDSLLTCSQALDGGVPFAQLFQIEASFDCLEIAEAVQAPQCLDELPQRPNRSTNVIDAVLERLFTVGSRGQFETQIFK